jgi:hypothetical protein
METPPVLVRQTNRLAWQNDLLHTGYAVVSSTVVEVRTESTEIRGEQVVCPEGYIILVDPNYNEI